MFTKLKLLLTYRNLLITNIFVVILKILYVSVLQKDFLTLEDFAIAHNIVYNHQYSEFIHLGATAFKLPVYPFFLSAFIWLFGTYALLATVICQALLSFFVPILIYKITELFDYGKVGILSGFLFLMSPAYFLYPGIIEASNLFIIILLLWFYLYFRIWFVIDVKSQHFIVLGIVTAILFLTQVVIVPLACLLVLALLIFKKINLKNFSCVVIISILFYSPWVIRNYLVFEQIVLSKTPAWQNIYFGFTENGQLRDDLKLIPFSRDHYLYQSRDEINEFKMENIYKNEVIKVTQNEPHYFIEKAASNFFCLWYVPPKYFDDNALSILFGRKIYVIVLNIFTMIALVLLYKRSRCFFWFSILFFGNFSFPYMIGHAANMRFKLDFEWFQLLLLAYVLSRFSKNYERKKRLEISKR